MPESAPWDARTPTARSAQAAGALLIAASMFEIVAMAHHRTDRPHGAIHQEVRTACGGPPTAMATVEDLEKRIAFLRSR